MENNELVQLLNYEFRIDLSYGLSYAALHAALSEHLNQLIKNDFEKLVACLYRVDVDEKKLKALLRENPDKDAGNLIASLIIERQVQKIETRKQFSRDDDRANDEERW